MIVVVCACNDVEPRYAYESTCPDVCPRCGVPVEVLLSNEDNKERMARGISLAAWFAAPRAPATRGECEAGARPCPFLRCRHQLGAPGRYGCAIDVAEDSATTPEPNRHHTLEHVGNQMDVSKERVRQLEVTALITFTVRMKRNA